MIDTKKLLDQFLGAGGAGALGGLGRDALGNGAKGGLGGVGDALSKGLGGNLGGLAGGALAGGLVSVLLGSKSARKLGGKAVTYGGLALVGALAYQAYRNWQANQAGNAPPMPANPAAPPALPPPETPFHPAHAPGGENALAMTLLHAMIAAAKADGHVDAEERERIHGRLSAIGLAGEDARFIEAELASPPDLERLVKEATSPEVAAEIYAASLLVITPDHPAERAYLELLAARLNIDPGLKLELEKAVAAQAAA
jgi:uncharacterized membrane protein YebE (DUF533 family)